jgi:hypothetical protein
MQLRRNRSPRSLGTRLCDESWINDRVQLIPRLKNWISTSYPGTLTGITEYNWGAESHINGATAQADILGIFGREGLDMAARWATPASTTPTYKAMKMYRNYDGAGSGFGESSVAATTVNADTVAAFAAQRSADGADRHGRQQISVGEHAGDHQPRQLRARRRGCVAVDRGQCHQSSAGNASPATASVSLPPQSITLFVVPGTSNVPSRQGRRPV